MGASFGIDALLSQYVEQVKGKWLETLETIAKRSLANDACTRSETMVSILVFRTPYQE